MHFKQKGNCLSLLLTITLSLPSAGRCEPAGYSPLSGSHLALPDNRNRVLTSRGGLAHSSKRGVKKRLPLDSRQGAGSVSLLYFDYSEDRDGTRTPVSNGRPQQSLKSRMASTTAADKGFNNRVKPRQTEEGRVYVSPSPASEACSRGEMTALSRGSFYVTGQVDVNVANVGYQADSAATGTLVFPQSSSSLFLCVIKAFSGDAKLSSPLQIFVKYPLNPLKFEALN